MEIAKQIRDKLAALATKLHEAAQHNGPLIRKTVNLIADEIDKLA
jgi:hypothetical protein